MSWETVELGKVTSKIGSGITPRGGASVYISEGTALIRSQNILDLGFSESGLAYISDEHAASMKSHCVIPGDVLLNITGDSTGRVVMWDRQCPAVVNQHVSIIRPKAKQVNSRWLQYFLVQESTKRYLLTLAASGGSRPALTKGMLSALQIPLPPLSQQDAIAGVLGALDDKIAANQRVMKLSDELIHAEYRRIDEYVVIPFTELRITNGAPFTGAHFNSHGEGFPLIRIRDLKTNTPQVWTTEQRTDSTEIQPGDLLVGLDAEFRPTTWLGAPGLLNQRMMKVSSEFYGSALLREAIRRPLAEIENYKTGTTVIHLNLMDLKQATVKVPKDSAVATIRSRMDSVYEAMVAKAQENQVLARTRDELLPLLMNGKISVAEASEAVEEVVGKHKEGDGDV